MLPAVLSFLATRGLSLLSDAVIAKGKAVIEEKIGMKLPTTLSEATPEVTAKLLEVQNAHQQFLVTAALEEKKIEAASETAASGEVSSRWLADMASDNKLSKNVRPGIIIYLTLVITIFAILSIWELSIAEVYVTLFGQLLLLVYGAYFVGRSVEKGLEIHNKAKLKD